MMKLVLNSVFLLAAILFFTKGFLLMKLEIGRKSPASTTKTISFNYDKIVILIIDALRYDFAFYQDDSDGEIQIFQNNMPIFHELMEEGGCEKARLWRFKADAPTTTMQRIKGLTTGSLPTFMDLSRNFASSEITEDNVLDQFRASGKNITFMGDDTWMGLFPGRFNKAFPYPSFDVKDLHLVDNGVLEHLLPEIRNSDWQMLIAHFLGVDHCGHRYGPYHPEMPLKLKQMNQVVKDVVDTIDSQTLLLVMGDHGMTPTGDHGGETFNEVNAALFAYSSKGGFKKCDGGKHVNGVDSVVDQVDIVPTISLLLGTSIPFANLGVVIGDMLPWRNGEKGNLLNPLDINAKQIHTYISAYQEITHSLPQESHHKLSTDFYQLINDSNHFNEKERRILKYIKSARKMCQLVWAKFNVSLMLCSLSLLVLWLVYNLKPSSAVCFTGSILLLAACGGMMFSLLMTSEFNDSFSLFVCCCSFLLLGAAGFEFFWRMYSTISQSKLFNRIIKLVIPVCFLAIYSALFTSNSFILNEDLTVLYLYISVFFFLTFQSCGVSDNRHITNKNISSQSDVEVKDLRHERPEENVSFRPKNCSSEKAQSTLSDRRFSDDTLPENCGSALTYRRKTGDGFNLEMEETSPDSVLTFESTFQPLLFCFVGVLSARLSFIFRSCRAEQFWCFDDTSSDLSVRINSNGLRVASSILTLIASILAASWALTRRYSLRNCYPVLCLVLSSLFCSCGWLYHHYATSFSLPDWCDAVFPRCVYGVLIVFFTFHWIDPISPLLPVVNKSVDHSTNHCEKDTSIFGRRSLRNEKPSELNLDNYIKLFASSIIIMILGFVCLLCLLLGPGMGASIPLWLTSAFCGLQLMSLSTGSADSETVPFSHVVLWNMMGSYWWFATGHQPSISSIRWDAAFVGFQGNHATNVIPALLLLLDTFSVQILTSVSLPLLIIWRRMGNRPTVTQSNIDGGTKGMMVSFSNWYVTCFQRDLNDVFFKHYCFYVVRMIGCMIASTLHRRHLMVWWIFAPKFLFEGSSFIIILCASLFGYVFAKNVGGKLERLEEKGLLGI